MCGIFGVIINSNSKSLDHNLIKKCFNKIKNRGPDYSELKSIFKNNEKEIFFGFHRLAINDLSSDGNQPMYSKQENILICNGEIYNFKYLKDKYNFDYKSKSDCEIILHLYESFGIESTLNQLEGYFSFLLFDSKKQKLIAARDHFGIRPMFIGQSIENDVYFGSELKSIFEFCDKTEQFPPGHYWSNNKLVPYYHYTYPIQEIPLEISINQNEKKNLVFNEEEICNNIRYYLTEAVKKRLMSDRPIGCLLSGGLDSSLISALVAKEFKNQNKGELNTFSIGMAGSTDLFYAQKVATHINSTHHHIELTPQDFLNAIPEVIYNIESYDTTTVRASVGNYLVGKYISENTECKVIFNGDGSDEQSGYLYLKNAPNANEFQNECINLLKEIHMFDVLRSDRSISSNWSLESRTPFLDHLFVNYYMSIDPNLKMYSKKKIEKYLLRKSFANDNLLPDEVLWRPKEAFSDGCSSPENSWHNIIKKFVEDKVTDQQMLEASKIYPHNTPQLKESYYYRQIFENFYPNQSHLIKHFWLPKWCGNKIDPSARDLNLYQSHVIGDCNEIETNNLIANL